ncbi:MAG: hypothetical protein JWN61_2451 [Pseudonocardiales bacterium]|nr:hypothetical protein [Jatrophihabitantaceae bacterium]MCW2604316.1 hypothetical protein [Pseudonocardiales bacterium]
MIVSVAFCPHPPLVVPQLAQGSAAELDDLRRAADAAIARVVASRPDQLLLVGSGDRSMLHSPLARGTLAGYGLDREFHLGSPSCGGSLELPLSLTVGAWLLERVAGPRSGALGLEVGPDYRRSRAAADVIGVVEASRVGLIVLGDGSARRTEQAPGYVDARAVPFDEAVEAALGAGDADALADLDLGLGAELLCAGAPAWAAAGDLLAGPSWTAALRWSGAPYGVGYAVADWVL